jgi:hypothetical protein
MVSAIGVKIITMMWVMTILSLIFLVLRIYCRIKFRKTRGWDDWILTVGWVVIFPTSRNIHKTDTPKLLLAAYTSMITASESQELGSTTQP